MFESTLKTLVKGNGFELRFQCHLWRGETKEDLWMDPALFYEKHTKKVPEFPHYEMELSGKVDGPKHIHQHQSERDPSKYFCCWTMRIESAEDAKTMFRLWSMGTAYTLVSGRDFIPKLQEVNGSISKFFEFMEKEYGATLVFE